MENKTSQGFWKWEWEYYWKRKLLECCEEE